MMSPLFNASGSSFKRFTARFSSADSFVFLVLLHDAVKPTVLSRPLTSTSTPHITLLTEVLSFSASSEKLVTVDDFIISLYPVCMTLCGCRKEKLHFDNYWKFKEFTLKSSLSVNCHVFNLNTFFLWKQNTMLMFSVWLNSFGIGISVFKCIGHDSTYLFIIFSDFENLSKDNMIDNNNLVRLATFLQLSSYLDLCI